jgi:hypothetical protein
MFDYHLDTENSYIRKQSPAKFSEFQTFPVTGTFGSGILCLAGTFYSVTFICSTVAGKSIGVMRVIKYSG